jgi:hypothetical protein
LGLPIKTIILYKEREEAKRRVFTKFLSKKQVKDFVFVDKSGINHQDIKEYAWSEKIKVIGEKSAAARHRLTTIVAGIWTKKSWHHFTSMITRIATTFAFGWEKFYAQNCVRSKW